MEKETVNFLDAEETAQKLVEALSKLQSEATSYGTASTELNDVKLELLNLIESTKSGVERSQAIIKLVGEIGGPEIIDRLARLEEYSQKSFLIQARQLDKLRVFLIATFATAVIAVIISIMLLVS
ncbi:hypothetical protein ACFLWR_00655 [Chloroflexota bacterium]